MDGGTSVGGITPMAGIVPGDDRNNAMDRMAQLGGIAPEGGIPAMAD